jgi:uncharacterized protein (UPF0333 family)
MEAIGGKLMDNKAQGALEYLLLIGGAVLVAAVVIAILGGMAGQQKNVISNAEGRITNVQQNLFESL